MGTMHFAQEGGRTDRIFTVTITHVDAKGRGIATTPKGPVAIPFVIPGDTVRIALRGRRQGVWRGKLLERTADGPHRITPRCPFVGQCGGCPWQMVDYAAQLRSKRAMVADAVHSLPIPEIPEVLPAPEIFYYRNRMDYVVGADGALGLKGPEQWWNVLDLTSCFLLSPEAVALMSRFRAWMRTHQVVPWNHRTHQGFARYLVIREGKRTGERLAMVVTAPGALPGRDDLIESFREHTTSLLWGVNPRITDLSIAEKIETLHGNDVLRERIGDQVFTIPPNAFFQTNSAMAEQLVATVRSFAALRGTEYLVDCYCGVGMFGIALARDAARVLGVESEPSAIPVAQENAVANGVTNATFQLGTVERWPFPLDPIDCCIIDPPRSGLHPRVIDKLLALTPARIIYVSCNPHALARDLKPLLTKYSCDAIQCLDLFPHTPHVETVVRLNRITHRGSGS
ncbi:23S rRNA (uracil(1939)-C(5))-methyltransferase RlmD [Candidatus Uhrbacteria bacterium]|nr:23S rRNA (uracil(1939)-C(5))-methyltransferase RlmD [Candidatus Uhrbacteria bacterium]